MLQDFNMPKNQSLMKENPVPRFYILPWHKIIAMAIFFNFVSIAFAQLSPGDLHKSHAHLEGVENCTKCHERGKKLNPKNCLTCHTILKERIENKKGLHANKEFRQCETCHIDHHGRDYDLIFWDGKKDDFDHSKTGFEHEGKHKELKCAKCHNPENIANPQKLKDKKKDLKRTFLGLDKKCLSCHNDEHRGQVDNKCLSCHNMQGWKPAPGFDHGKTKFKLTGKHQKVKCESCHKPVTDNKFSDDKSFLKFSGLKFNSCNSCHKDVHNTKFGANCATCHNTSGWQNYSRKNFNHEKTKFPLKGLHKNVECEKCHKLGKPLKIKKFSSCNNCHSDEHKGQFLGRAQKGACEECHTVKGFVPSTFTTKMHAKCDYPLQGSHLAVPCFACHKKIAFSSRGTKTTQFTFKSTQCATCHDDVHKGQTKSISQVKALPAGKDMCQVCHQVESWSKINFDHDATQFVLTGGHKNTDCASCHKKEGKWAAFWAFKDLDSNCISCHKDQHQGQFKTRDDKIDCAKCHSPVDWFAEKFDHEKNTKFSLKGAHQFVECKDCHKNETKSGMEFVRYKPLERKCESCHLEKKRK